MKTKRREGAEAPEKSMTANPLPSSPDAARRHRAFAAGGDPGLFLDDLEKRPIGGETE